MGPPPCYHPPCLVVPPPTLPLHAGARTICAWGRATCLWSRPRPAATRVSTHGRVLQGTGLLAVLVAGVARMAMLLRIAAAPFSAGGCACATSHPAFPRYPAVVCGQLLPIPPRLTSLQTPLRCTWATSLLPRVTVLAQPCPYLGCLTSLQTRSRCTWATSRLTPAWTKSATPSRALAGCDPYVLLVHPAVTHPGCAGGQPLLLCYHCPCCKPSWPAVKPRGSGRSSLLQTQPPPPAISFLTLAQVIQILLARDKATGQPKGSAYIWFQRRRDADLASESFHFC